MDSNYWGLLCVPIGLLVGFAPALIATLLTPEPVEESEDARNKSH
jgi:hypothetical protein